MVVNEHWTGWEGDVLIVNPKDSFGVLISVKNSIEAQMVADFPGVSVVDLKNPLAGSLGCSDFSVAQEVADTLQANFEGGDSRHSSIALGEVIDGNFWPNVHAEQRDSVLSKFSFAKMGLSGLAHQSDWPTRWQSAFQRVPKKVTRVAVAYADWELAEAPAPDEIIQAAPTIDAKILLVDTFCKSSGNLWTHLDLDQIKSISQRVRALGMQFVVAGSLSLQDCDSLVGVADLLAFRGAFCSGARTGCLDEKLIAQSLPAQP